MQTVGDVLREIFRTGTPESPVDIHLQNEQMRTILAEIYQDEMEEILNQDADL